MTCTVRFLWMHAWQFHSGDNMHASWVCTWLDSWDEDIRGACQRCRCEFDVSFFLTYLLPCFSTASQDSNELNALKDAIASKADTEDVDALRKRLGDKVDKAELDALLQVAK